MTRSESVIDRRDFLRVGAAFVGKAALESASIRPPEVEIPSDWNSIAVKSGDTLWSICNYYGIPDQQGQVAEVNQIIPYLIYAGQKLFLPIEENFLQLPFTKFSLEGREPDDYFLFTDLNGFLKYNEKMLLCEGDNYPYVITGHSSPDSSLSSDYPFHWLLRDLNENRKLELKFWLERSNGKGYLEGVLKGDHIGYSPDHREINQANSRNLILRTCAVETPSPDDVLYCHVDEIIYNSAGPKN